jgi:MFS family permease
VSSPAAAPSSRPVSVYYLYALALTNATSVNAAQVVLSLYALNHGASPFAIGALAASFSMFPMLLAVIAGRLVDRFGARWPMTAGAIGGGLGLLVPWLVPGVPAVYIAGLMTGFAVIFFNLATQNLVGLLSTPETRARNFSNYMLVNSASSLMGPLLGGFSIDHSDHATACLVLSALTLIPITMLLTRGGGLPAGTRPHAKAGSGGGVRAMLADPVVRRTLITGSLLNTGINLYQFYMPVYGHSIGLSASSIGIVLAMNSAAAFVSRFMLPKLIARFGESRMLRYAFVAGAASLTLIPLFGSAVALGAISFAFGLGMGCGQPIVIMLMYSNSRDGRSGEALGLKFTTNQLTKLISPVLFGAIATALGLWPMFWLNAAMLATGGYFSRAKQDRDRAN